MQHLSRRNRQSLIHWIHQTKRDSGIPKESYCKKMKQMAENASYRIRSIDRRIKRKTTMIHRYNRTSSTHTHTHTLYIYIAFRYLPEDCCLKKLRRRQTSMTLKTNLIYMYLLLLYNSSILNIEHSPNYIALGSPQIHKVNQWQPTLLQYMCMCMYVCEYIYFNSVSCHWFTLWVCSEPSAI